METKTIPNGPVVVLSKDRDNLAWEMYLQIINGNLSNRSAYFGGISDHAYEALAKEAYKAADLFIGVRDSNPPLFKL